MEVLVSLFHWILKDGEDPPIPPTPVERAYRLPRMTGGEGQDPGEVACYLPDFQTQDRIIRRAWVLGPCDYMGGEVKILPELSGATLSRRG